MNLPVETFPPPNTGSIREKSLKQSIRITNIIASIFAGLTLFLLGVNMALFGPSASTVPLIVVAIVFASIIPMNGVGITNFSRILLSTFTPLITLYIAYVLKKDTLHSDVLYYDSRFVLIIFGTVPCLIFNAYEKSKLYSLLAFNFVCLLAFDPLHEALGQGYYQKGFTGASYYYINYISAIAFVAIAAGSLTLKIITERSQSQREILIKEKEEINNQLQQKNLELHDAINAIETQNEEMVSQAEILKSNQEKLEEANATIQHQKNLLTEHNEKLEKLVAEKNSALVHANSELIKHNNELRQFSYTVSHNLRAPIARLLGLTDLLSKHEGEVSPEMQKLIDLISGSASEFDGIIRDLNKIIDIRNELYRIKEKVDFQSEWDSVRKILAPHITGETNIQIDFSQAGFAYTIRPVLNSILYNLVSNAFKYRSPHRPLELKIHAYKKDGFIVLEVSDNGLGMNLESHGKDIFGLYKRFHTHTDGRGLGLYLVKSQIETLGGKIEVKSTLNSGTSFFVYFKIETEVEGQICFNSEFGSIYYNARTNTAGMIWHKQPDSQQYRVLFTKCLEIVRLYGTPYWLSDLRKQGTIAAEDQKWMTENIMVDAIRSGLQRIAGIYDPAQLNEDYRKLITAQGEKMGVEIRFFSSRKASEDWIEEHMLSAQAQA